MISDINFPLTLSLLFICICLLLLAFVGDWLMKSHQANNANKNQEMFSTMVDWRSYEKPAYARRNRKV